MIEKNKYNFAFLVHSRDYRDIYKKFKLARFIPRKIIELWCFFWPPIFVTEIRLNHPNKAIKGMVIAIPMTAEQMIKNKERAIKRVSQAIRKAEKKGIKNIGLGALTSSVTNGGELVKKDNLNITTGNSLTASVAIEHIKEILQNNNIKKIGIVGGTGSIGTGIISVIVDMYPEKEYIVFARTEKNLNTLLAETRKRHREVFIEGRIKDLTDLINCDLVVVTTSASDAIIHSQHLKKNCIIYDVTQPQNIDKKTLAHRKDLVIYDGGLIYSENVDFNFSLGLPKKVIFSCLGETILLAAENFQGNFLGKTNTENIKLIKNISDKYNFKPYSIEHKI